MVAPRTRSTAGSRHRCATSYGPETGSTARSSLAARPGGWRWGTGEDVFRLEAALRSGLMARGVPKQILVDRGSPFVSSQLLRACAVLGVKLIHASPRAAATKGKIERGLLGLGMHAAVV